MIKYDLDISVFGTLNVSCLTFLLTKNNSDLIVLLEMFYTELFVNNEWLILDFFDIC